MRAVVLIQLQSLGQASQRGLVRSATDPPFDVADAAVAQTCAFGQSLLRQTDTIAVAAHERGGAPRFETSHMSNAAFPHCDISGRPLRCPNCTGGRGCA